MYYTYILKSTEGRYYVGQTSNLEIRINQHNEGRKGFTKKYKQWRLIHSEEFRLRSEAIRRERKIKSLKFGDTFRRHFDAEWSSGSSSGS